MNYTIKRYFNGQEEEKAPFSHQIKNHDVLNIIDHAIERNNNQIINKSVEENNHLSSISGQLTYESKEY